MLAPLRVDVALDGRRFSDYLLWDLGERRVTPEHFARQTCVDLDLPCAFEPLISRTMRAQIAQFASYASAVSSAAAAAAAERPVSVAIDVQIGGVQFRDALVWGASPATLAASMAAAEPFAARTVRDLGLPPEFAHAIAWTIRDQVFRAIGSQCSNPQQKVSS